MITLRLSLMMFLQFFIWGGWFVTLGTYLSNTLQANGGQIGMAFSTQSWGAIIAPFIIGLIADRFFNAEKILGILHIVGAVLMFFMYQADSFSSFYPYVLAYMIAYMPTLALVNSVSFGQMDDPSKQFGKVRVWGTVGWIVAGLMISYAFSWDSAQSIADGMLKNTFLTLQYRKFSVGYIQLHTTQYTSSSKWAESNTARYSWARCIGVIKRQKLLRVFLSSVLICIPLAFYYQNANPFLTEIGVENATGKMTLGQVSEVLFMLALPIFLNRFGIKATLVIGMAAWVIRYTLFAFGNADEGLFMLIVGIALHGICYDFFFVSGQIYTNAKAGENIKSAAQGLITLATYGVGMLVGFAVAGAITDTYTLDGGSHSWQQVWLFPAGFAAVVLVVFALLFKKRKVNADA